MVTNVSWIANFFIAGCLLLPYPSLLTAAHYYDPHSHYQSWYRPRLLPLPPRRAMDLMSDIINELGIRILQQYVESGNVAFSPAGVGFILAALYEGSSSHSRQQIIDSLGMPRDKNVVRIGMRDIHKRLRTYLNPDGFLGGLNLNRENTTLRAEYENILRFYGFDLTIDLSDFTVNSTSNFGLKGSTSTMSSATMSEMQTTTMTSGSTNIPMSAANGTMTSADSTTMQPDSDTSTVDSNITMTPTVMPSIPFESSTASQSDFQTSGSTLPMTISTSISTSQSITTNTSVPTTMAVNATLTSTILPLNLAETTTPTEDIATVASPTNVPTVMRRRRTNRRRRSNEAYFSTFPDDGLWMQDLNIWSDHASLPTNIRDSAELQFLVNGCDLANVPAASYSAVLPFAYSPSLKAAVLEFPLDNPRYNVMLLLPTEGVDTGRLARELFGHSLRLLRKQLQATWVHTTIPSFMLRGFVTLTPYLQRLGIKDVFEPRLADLSLMTPDLGVYARDVQQSIAVNIRNYMKENNSAGDRNGTESSSGNGANLHSLLQEKHPLILPPRTDDYRFQRPANGLSDRVVSFKVDHPFLYFIVDDETSAALIAGRIDDPLNSRIL